MSPDAKDLIPDDSQLFRDIASLIKDSKQQAAQQLNAQLTELYWRIGKRFSESVLGGERAAYGQQVIRDLSRELTVQHGRGWSAKQLHHCLRFAETFPDFEIVSALRRQLSWTHIKSLIYLDDPLKREFYRQLAVQERWSTRTLAERMDSQLYERTAISNKPEETIQSELTRLEEGGRMSPDLLLKDPYILDFLGLNDSYLERDLEDAILRELQQFLLELGTGFSFIGRQYRIQVDDDDYAIDLLFYNRKLRRLVAIDLKVGRFKPEYKGQMELYLRWLAKHEQQEGEQPPLGIILCAEKKYEQIELLELDAAGIHVAEYLTTLPAKEILQTKLQEAMARARLRLAAKAEDEKEEEE